MSSIEVASSVDDALRRLAAPGRKPLAGGVGVLLAIRLGAMAEGRYVGVGRLAELRVIEVEPVTGAVRLGGAVTLAEMAASDVLRAAAPLAAAAAAAAASPGIRSVATLAGNVVDAPAASDLAASLMALDATLEVRALAGNRSIRLQSLAARPADFLEPGEIVAALRIPAASGVGWSLQRLRTQGAADRPAVTVALTASTDGGRVTRAGAAATFIGDRPVDLAEVSDRLVGVSRGDLASPSLREALDRAALAAVDRARADGLVLLDDLRASAAYRRELVGVLAVRAAIEAVSGTSA